MADNNPRPFNPIDAPVPADIVRALEGLGQINPHLIEGVYRELHKRIGAISDPAVLIKQEERRMQNDRLDFWKSIAAYSLIAILALILAVYVGKPLADGNHPVEAATLMGASFVSIILAILNPFKRRDDGKQEK